MKIIIIEYEGLVDQDLNAQLPTNEIMDDVIGKNKHVREQCTICSCEKFEKYRSNVRRCDTRNIIQLFYRDNILSTEVEWY